MVERERRERRNEKEKREEIIERREMFCRAGSVLLGFPAGLIYFLVFLFVCVFVPQQLKLGFL